MGILNITSEFFRITNGIRVRTFDFMFIRSMTACGTKRTVRLYQNIALSMLEIS